MSAVLKHDPLSPYRIRALEDAVQRVMWGERVPKRGFPAIDLLDFLDQCVPVEEQTEDFARLIVASSAEEISDIHLDITNKLEKRLREHLCGSEITEILAQEMADEAEEDSHE